MEYVLGIDSGGTNYRVMAGSLDGKRLGYYVGKPANLHYLSDDELLERMNENIDGCLKQFSGKRKDARYLVSGTTGIDSDGDAARLQRCYESLEGLSCPMRLMNDAELAHYTVTGGKGILIISGTGSIAFGVNSQGKSARAGGWPLPMFGDEGSGTWVTKKALRHYGRFLDRGVEESPLTRLISSQAGIKTREELILTALRGERNPADFPQLGSLVNQAADEGDSYALAILKGAAEELLTVIEDLAYALELEKTEPGFSVGVWGGNIVKSKYVLQKFTELLGERYPLAKVILPEKEAVEGAVLMAVKCCAE